jgi:hypothetical protein
MSPRAYEYIVKKYLKEAGIKGASVHTLRHTFATHHVAKLNLFKGWFSKPEPLSSYQSLRAILRILTKNRWGAAS